MFVLRLRFWIRAGLITGLFCFPFLVLVDKIHQEWCLLGISSDKFVFQKLFSCWPLAETRQILCILIIHVYTSGVDSTGPQEPFKCQSSPPLLHSIPLQKSKDYFTVLLKSSLACHCSADFSYNPSQRHLSIAIQDLLLKHYMQVNLFRVWPPWLDLRNPAILGVSNSAAGGSPSSRTYAAFTPHWNYRNSGDDNLWHSTWSCSHPRIYAFLWQQYNNT